MTNTEKERYPFGVPRHTYLLDKAAKPEHYRRFAIDVLHIASACDFITGNVIKYIARWQHKGEGEADLKKALWYCGTTKKFVCKATFYQQEEFLKQFKLTEKEVAVEGSQSFEFLALTQVFAGDHAKVEELIRDKIKERQTWGYSPAEKAELAREAEEARAEELEFTREVQAAKSKRGQVNAKANNPAPETASRA